MKNEIIKNHFRKISFLPAILAVTLSTNANADVNDTIEKTFSFDSDGKIQLSNVNGDVSISACGCNEVHLIAEITASNQEIRDRITVEIDESSSNLRIKTRYKNNENRKRSWNNGHSQVTYTLSVPNDVQLSDIDLVNGDLKINGVTGKLKADLVNGELHSDGLTSTTSVNMVNGDMDIKFADLSNAERVNLESVNGNITVYLPSDADATLDAETVSGRISNEFGINVVKHKYVGSEMRGAIGGGGVKINLDNVNGRIEVKSH
ncbi:DUF4097 family beta strand repeat-containing protein [Aliikangiella coralliicola]|uniref:DUF4097 domain-containing protein n=1 Tax=Aliikangiella coralliicola TaxID=2592383 RepID=A0A545UBL1_9GAMM|nr:DUF4097 family beta strand repeat-containing protein [Aliikangiella coralliicola]TQV86852.1 DUF4097 domain-containing protein [Aliikangiella coralliicola]